MSPELRVRFQDEVEVVVPIHEGSKFEDVAEHVRTARGWADNQHVRFISGGQEMYLQDSVSRATTYVVHCIATDVAQRYVSAKQAAYKNSEQAAASVDWLEVVDPGTVLMWIFGSILGLLWVLFVFYAHMFDKTSVVMLCMMTIAFLIPCVLSYVPWLHMHVLTAPPQHMSPVARQQQQQHVFYYGSTAEHSSQQQLQRQQHSAYANAYPGTAYTTAVPPRPAARVRGPGPS